VTPHIARSAGARSYILHPITMPVFVAAIDTCSWDELHKALRTMGPQTTSANNWMMTELLV
jgi:hypothetical protein